MCLLYAIVQAMVLSLVPFLIALLFFKFRVMVVAPVRWLTFPRYAKVLIRLVVAVCMWVLLAAVCFLYSFMHPSGLALAGLALLVLWYFYIPFFFVVVSVAWFTAEKVAERRQGKYKSFI